MLRRLQALSALGFWLALAPAAAQDPIDEPAEEPGASPPATESAEAPAPGAPSSTESAAEADAGTEAKAGASVDVGAGLADAAPAAEREPAEDPKKGWNTFVSGYFRAPMSLGISPRRGPDDQQGEAQTQISYGPNRTIDHNYYSFAYTRLQEQDWAEVFIHAKKEHVEAVVGWMGYWLSAAGFRNYDAAWVPGMAYLTLDTDVPLGALKPNVALTAGAFWPSFGYFEKYDTLTLGRFRHIGEQLKLTIPFNSDLTVTAIQGFGTGRDGSFQILSPSPYQATVGATLIHYEHLSVAYKDYVDLGLHFNHQWTRDPKLFISPTAGKSYTDARDAKFTTVGGELTVSAPFAGRLWVSPSYTRVLNGWALDQAGTELMHSLGATGFATNYLGWSGDPRTSTGTGSSFNLGFLYENTLSSVLGKPGGKAPEVTLNVFGLMADASLTLPETTAISQDRIAQMKYGADVTVQALDWLGIMLRWDEVNYDLDNSGYVFSSITPRVTVSSHFMSGESVYIQYSRYRYGDNMTLAGTWPWNEPLIAGSRILQGDGVYTGHKPDMDVIKLQAQASF